MGSSINTSSNLEIFSAWSLVLLVYSGVFKWVPFLPVDLTILSFVLAVFCTLLFLLKSAYLDKSSAIFLGLTLCYFTVFLCTAIYTYSNTFWKLKALTLLLNFIALLMPMVCFRSSHTLRLVENILIAVGVIFAVIIMCVYQLGLLDLLRQQTILGNEVETPNYLVLSICLGVAAILLLTRGSSVNYFLAFFCVLAMLLLAGRGPLVFLLLTSSIILHNKSRNRNIVTIIVSLGFLSFLLLVLAFWEGAEVTVRRFSAIGIGENISGSFRLDDLRTSITLIQEHIFFGVGIGGYGQAGFSIDENYYPHNLFLESLLETGLVGFTIFMTSIFYLLKSIYSYRRLYSVFPYVCLLLFISFNYMKSGGFIGARDLYFYIGLVFAAAVVAKKEVRTRKEMLT